MKNLFTSNCGKVTRTILFVLAVCLLFFSSTKLKAQVYSGDANLTTQAQVDAFNYTSVTGNLTLFGSSITNLNGLSNLNSIGGVLEITNTFLTNIDGLSNLTSVSKDLFIRGNSGLTNLNGFSSLTSVGRAIYFLGNSSLTNFDGLLSLTSTVEGIRVAACPMVNLNGFSNVHDVTGFLEFEDDPHLASLDGLEGLQGADIVNSIKINHNPLLQNINGLLSIKRAGGIQIIGNNILPNVDGLANLTAVESMIVSDNPALVNIDGLTNIQTMSGSLWIRSNTSLADLNGLGNLTTIGKEFIIDGDYSLTHIDGLTNLTTIGTNLIISINYHLADLNGLQNLTHVGNDLDITTNTNLVDFCGLTKLFTTGTIAGDIDISHNGANTVTITPTNVTVNADQGVCSAVISEATLGDPVNGCLVPITKSHSAFPVGNIFPVGTTNITWTATDGANNTASAIQQITVIDNQPPVITSCPSNISVSCAADVPAANTNLVTATDNCSATVTHAGDVITNQTCANRFTLTRTYRATDGAGNTAECSQTITVNDNTPPQITGLSPSQSALWPPNHTMRDITLTYTVTDNCSTDATTTVTVTSNEPVNGVADGDTDPDWIVVDNHHIKLRAERAANGTGRIYTITVTTTDGCNAPVSATTQVMVVHNITGPNSGRPFIAGSTVNFSGEFWDKPTNKHSAKWLIDGSSSVKGSVTEPTTNKNGKVTGSYRFNSPGVYKLQMNITDQAGVTSYANTNGDIEEIVVIYDPNGGYTYGGGWFASQAGAVVADPLAEGKASYGFTVNYFKNSTYPKGETQFEFKVGSFEFNALNFDYLVINGSKAQFRGTGKITGDQSGYGFIMTVIDGDLDATGVDKIRMKIYNKTNGRVVYDNQPGASDAADPIVAVGDNSSVVIYSTSNLLTTAQPEREILPVSFEVNAMPNPSNTNFTVNVSSNDLRTSVNLQVFDMYGRMIEQKIVNSNSRVRLGDTYNTGVYIVKLTQGKNQKQLKLVKSSGMMY